MSEQAVACSPPPNRHSITRSGFTISIRKDPILKAGPIDDMTKKLGIAPPEMIFGDNLVSIQHVHTGWGIEFNAFDALDRVDKTGQSALKVAYSGEWQRSREKTHEGIKEVVRPFDWSYTTDYKGTVISAGNELRSSSTPLPLDRLRRHDPILFFEDVILYEDELADNGISMLSCKVRVMPSCLLLLCRFFMRLDNVLFRLRDTRVFIDFDTHQVIREYLSREAQYDVIRQKLAATREDIPAVMRDPNKLAEMLPIVDNSLESVVLPQSLIQLRRFFQVEMLVQKNLNLNLLTALFKDANRAPFDLSEITRKPIQRPWFTSQLTSKSSRCFASTSSAKPVPLQDPAPLPKPARRGPAGLRSAETYVAYGITKKLFDACSAQADYKIPQVSQKNTEIPKTASGEDLGVGQGWWYEDLGLLPTFSSWSQVTFLHMYLISVRLRALPSTESFQTFSRHLFDHFSNHAEDRMDVIHNIRSRAIRVKYLKDLFLQWRGVIAAYDEGLVKGDAVLAAALWRNLYKGSYVSVQNEANEIDWNKIAQVVLYMRKVLGELAPLEEADMAHSVGGEKGLFKSSQTDDRLVSLEARSLQEPFVPEPVETTHTK
ncbi:Serine carboxypeptidase 3 [Ophidiomyces ophidiicola]|nr:Serine carboxypeptidase 3 [Ophidiomyces ophidiicola]KAI1987372.1 Serine carboxypeptidase 3 [Ophidiomyces ophidiicola]KAI1997865.1 Serine carboxypeptidase 3 [Ophidiomyces ophidiicola]